MKLNNKGFAITTIIYGTLVLFLLLLTSLLGILSTHKLRIYKLKEKTTDIIENEELKCEIIATPSGETIGNEYYSIMTLKLSSNKNNVTYSIDGKNVSEMTLSSTKTGAVTYNGKVEKDGETATCSITVSQRKEYSQRTCQAEYGSWTVKSVENSTDISLIKNCLTASAAEAGGYLHYEQCLSYTSSKTCNIVVGEEVTRCYSKRSFVRTCTSINCGTWKAWTTTSKATGCITKQRSRMTYAI